MSWRRSIRRDHNGGAVFDRKIWGWKLARIDVDTQFVSLVICEKFRVVFFNGCSSLERATRLIDVIRIRCVKSSERFSVSLVEGVDKIGCILIDRDLLRIRRSSLQTRSCHRDTGKNKWE